MLGNIFKPITTPTDVYTRLRRAENAVVANDKRMAQQSEALIEALALSFKDFPRLYKIVLEDGVVHVSAKTDGDALGVWCATDDGMIGWFAMSNNSTANNASFSAENVSDAVEHTVAQIRLHEQSKGLN